MGIIAETPTWEPTIYSLETTDPVEGGVTGISNRSRIELTNRTAKIKDVLNKHGIEVDPASAIGFTGQWIDVDPTFEGSVINSDVVYYNIGNARYEKALADGTTKQHFVGVADITNNKVIGGGFLGNPVIVGVPVQGSIIYLSDTLPGVMTTTASAVAVGKWLFTGTMMLNAGVGGAGGAGGSYLHEQDTYRMLLQDSYYKNAFFDQLLDDIFITHDMEFDFGSNKLEFSAGEQVTSSGNLKDPLVALTIDEAFLSVDIDDSGATVFELSADGGSNWEVTGNNAVHLFSNTGSDLRIRITGGGSGEIRSYGIMYNPDPQLATSIGMLHSEVVDDESEKHREINDSGSGATDLWSAAKINGLIPVGLTNHPLFDYNSTIAIRIGFAQWQHWGTVNQVVTMYPDTFTFGPGGSNGNSDSLGPNQWQYLYIRDLDVSGPIITDADLVNDTSVPTYIANKNAFMWGDNRLVGAFRTNVSSQIIEFYHMPQTGLIEWADDDFLYNTHPGNTNWNVAEVTFEMPSLGSLYNYGIQAYATFHTLSISGAAPATEWFYRPTGSANGSGQILARGYFQTGDTAEGMEMNTRIVTTNSNGQIDLRATNSDTDLLMRIYQNGYFLPIQI
jgi:hypothetical protein